jgi:hemerythrin-like metal-binding protein
VLISDKIRSITFAGSGGAMPRVEWNDFLSVGHARIDEDHKRLFEILNRLADGAERCKRAVVADSIEQMIRYAGEHFAREEELMAKIHYPLTAEHTQRHRELAAKVLGWRTKIAERWHPWHGGTFFVVLAHWLVSHIMEDDRMLADFRRTGNIVQRFKKTKAEAPPPLPAGEVRRGQGLAGRPDLSGYAAKPRSHPPASRTPASRAGSGRGV